MSRKAGKEERERTKLEIGHFNHQLMDRKGEKIYKKRVNLLYFCPLHD